MFEILIRRTPFDDSPLLEMSRDSLLRINPIPRLLYPAHIQRPILPIKAPNASHVITIVGELVPRKTVLGGVWESRLGIGQAVQVLAFPTVRTTSPRKEEADVFYPRGVSASETSVSFNVAAGLGFSFAVMQVLVNVEVVAYI
jgi:hypothetical protein